MSGLRERAEPGSDGPRKRIAVIGGRAWSDARGAPAAAGLPAPLKLLESVFPVSFEQGEGAGGRGAGGGADRGGVDAAVVLEGGRLGEARGDVPRLVLGAGRYGHGETRVVALSDGEQLARALRGRGIADDTLAGELPNSPNSPEPPTAGDEVLASVDGRPVWWRANANANADGVGDGLGGRDGSGAGLWFSVYPLAELAAGETLREHLKAGRFMGLLPVVHFLGEVVGEEGWRLPPVRASFVVDDPNLHWRSYGYLKYGELIGHAGRHNYHLGLATVPLDGWWVDRRAAALVRENGSVLSLLMHGNDHLTHELGRLGSEGEAERAMAQALRRTAALERRAGVGVERVMVPPHSRCSEEALGAMFRLGVEGVCLNRAYPWRDELAAPGELSEWGPAELVAGGMPMLLRSPLVDGRDDLAFRALLGQPLILYGHHWDFAEGLDILAEAAKDINALGEVRWGPLGPIARSNYATRRVGETLYIRMYARGIELEVPAGVGELRVLAQEPLGGAGWRRVSGGEATAGMTFAAGEGASEPLAVDSAGRIAVALIPDRPLNSSEVPAPGRRPWSVVRRLLVEGRDRVRGLR